MKRMSTFMVAVGMVMIGLPFAMAQEAPVEGLTAIDQLILERIDDVKIDLKADIAEVKIDLKADIAEVKTDISQRIDDKFEEVNRRTDDLKALWTIAITLIASLFAGMIAILISPIYRYWQDRRNRRRKGAIDDVKIWTGARSENW